MKGSSSVVKIGTKVRNIRLIDGTGGHDIDCKIDGVGPMQLEKRVREEGLRLTLGRAVRAEKRDGGINVHEKLVRSVHRIFDV